MGREPEAHRPGWILEWLTWVLGEALSEPAEQQTRMVPHTFERATFYRIDYQMQRSIGPDKVKEIETLVGYGRTARQPGRLEGHPGREGDRSLCLRAEVKVERGSIGLVSRPSGPRAGVRPEICGMVTSQLSRLSVEIPACIDQTGACQVATSTVMIEIRHCRHVIAVLAHRRASSSKAQEASLAVSR